MKAIIGRLRRLEQRGLPQLDVAWKRSQQAADVLRERMRRRCVEAGEVYEELPWETVSLPAAKRLSIAETLRIGRQLAHQRAAAGQK